MYFGIIFLIVLVVPLVIIPLGMMNMYRSDLVIGVSIFTTAAFVAVALAAAQHAGGMTLGEQVLEQIEKIAYIIASSEELSAQAGLGDLAVNERAMLITNLYAMVNSIFPAMLIFWSGVYSYLVYKATMYILKKKKKIMTLYLHLKVIRWRIRVPLAFSTMLAISLIMESFGMFAGANLSLNIALITEYIIALEGLGAMMRLLNRYRNTKVLKALVVFFGVFTSPGRMLLCMVGLMEFTVGLGRIFPMRKK